ncbi:putative F-box protein At2g36090 [Apium graveolens]|uniref:putative F-box protein At2g36090 n=1 Tax=Apium graveolens TaxID=4045 RepID=UPI003D7BD321
MDSKCCDHGGATTTISAVHTDVIESHILTKFDGASLACAASTSHLLHNLCNKQSLWEDVCNATWDSIKDPLVRKTISDFSGGYRGFYSDAFPVIRSKHGRDKKYHYEGNISELISAVDIHYGDEQIFSKVIVTDTDNKSFLHFSFWVDLFDNKQTVKIPLKFEGDEKKCMLELEQNLKLSWIVIDPTKKRAVNVSSLRPVSVQPSWNGYDIQVIFATILSGEYDVEGSDLVECRVAATLGCKEGKYVKFREVILYSEDMQMRRLSGKKSLKILEQAMESGERKKENGGEMKEIYEKYLDLKRNKMEGKKRKERVLNLVYKLSWVAYFFAFVFLCSSLNVFPN